MLYFEIVLYAKLVAAFLLRTIAVILVFLIIRDLYCAYKQHKAFVKMTKELEQTYERYNNEPNS